MGLTIHYSLKSNTRGPKKVRELVARLRGRALDLPFAKVEDIVELTGEECDFERLDQDDPHRWLLIQAGQYVDRTAPGGRTHSYHVAPTHLIAFETLPGDGCESANFGLSRYPAEIKVTDSDWPYRERKIRTRLSGWSWQSFCKTQYASNAECGGVENFLRCHLAVIRVLDQAKSLGILEDVSDEGDFWKNRDVRALAEEVGQWNQTIAAFAGELMDLLDAQTEDLAVKAPITESPNFEHLEVAGRGKE